jgi:hypothetical protein
MPIDDQEFNNAAIFVINTQKCTTKNDIRSLPSMNRCSF